MTKCTQNYICVAFLPYPLSFQNHWNSLDSLQGTKDDAVGISPNISVTCTFSTIIETIQGSVGLNNKIVIDHY